MDKISGSFSDFLQKGTFLVALLLLALQVSCSKKQEEAKILIQFDSKVFSNAHKSVVAKQNATNAGGPNWGATDPQVLSDLSCFGIFAFAEEEGMNESTCTRSDGTVIMKFGPRAGFFPMNKPGEILVPMGDKRTFYLLAMSSLDGDCEKGFAESSEFKYSNYSNPFLLGSATVDITAGDTTVPIELVEDFSEERKLNSCDFIEPDEDDEDDGNTPDGPASDLYLTHYPSNRRSIWVDDNALPRTVSFTYDANSMIAVDCSRDGTNYSAADCNSATSLVWNVGEEANTHGVRVIHADGTVETATFIPTVEHGTMSFVSCDYEFDSNGNYDTAVSSSATGAVAFLTALGTGSTVSCFSDNVTIANGGATENLTDRIASNVTLIARQGQSAKIDQNDLNDILLAIGSGSSATNINLVGLTLESEGGGGYNTVGVFSMADNIVFDSCTIQSVFAAASAQAVHVNQGGSSGMPIKFINSIIKSISNAALYGFNPTTYIYVENSTIESDYYNLQIGSGVVELTVKDSKLINNGTSATDYLLRNFSGNPTIHFDNNLFLDHSGGGLDMVNGTTLILDDNRFRRTNNATAGHNTSFIKIATGSLTINSSNDGNSFCHEDSVNAAILSGFPIGGGGTYAGTYTAANQVNAGVTIDGPSVGGCP